MKSEGYLPSRPLVLTYKELDIELIPMSTARLEKTGSCSAHQEIFRI